MGTGLTGGPFTTTGTLNVDVGTAANKILQLTSSAQIPAVDGFLVTNVNAVKLQGRNLAATVPGNGQTLGWNSTSSQWEPTSATSGTVTAVATGNGLLGGPISGTGTLTVDVGTAANKIVQMTAAATLPAVDGYLLTNLNATRIGTRQVATTLPTSNQILTWNNSTTQWEPQPNIAATGFVNGGNSFGANSTIGNKDAFKLGFLTNNNTVMTLDPSGNLGIGIGSPTATLHVYGNSANPALYIQQAGTGAKFQIGSSADLFVSYAGNVGIGTTSPNSALNIEGGDLTIRTASSQAQIFVGRDASVNTYPGIWFGNAAATHTTSNFTFLYDQGTTGSVVNTPTGGYIQFRIGNDSANGLVLDSAKNLVVGGAYNSSGAQKLDVRGGATFSGNVGVGTTNPEFKLSLNSDGGIIAKGSTFSGASLTTAGAGTRMVWYPRAAAFRAGEVTSTQWDDVNIGVRSFAVGSNPTASGASAFAANSANTASGGDSSAFGQNSVASGQRSFVQGTRSTASGDDSVALGDDVIASAQSAMVVGRGSNNVSPLTNNLANSLMVGFNSDIPTLFVGPASGPGTIGNVGVGTTSPSAKLDVSGHVANSGAAAAVGTCGTSPAISGNDTRGVVTLGTGGPTACTITFASAYTTAPYCVITPHGGNPGAIQWWISETTTTLVMTFSAAPTASQQFEYHCMQ